MAQKTTIMNVNVEDDDEVNLVKDARPDQIHAINVERWDISREIVNMMGIDLQKDRHLLTLMILL